MMARQSSAALKLQRVKFQWQPFSLKQQKVLSWWLAGSPYYKYDALICDGAIRSGKTVVMVYSYVIWANATFDGQLFAICSKTIGAFRRNVLNPLKRMLMSSSYVVEEHRGDNLITISNYNQQKRKVVSNYFYIFGGKDEASQDLIQGITLAGVFFDEVALMPESFVNQATARCSIPNSKYWFNCNPEGPFHWFYVEWIKQLEKHKALRLHFTMDDNLSLSKEVKERYARQYSGVFFDRFILGKWVQADGVIYSMFSDEENIVPTKFREYTDFYVTCDYGTKNPTVFILWGKCNNKWYAIKEYYYDGRKTKIQKADIKYADDLDKFLNNDKSITIIVDPSAASFITELRDRGYDVLSANNDVLDGIRLTASCIDMRYIVLNDCCVMGIQEMHTYAWDEKACSKGDDKPLKENDHWMDAMRYFVNNVIKYELDDEDYAEEIYKKGLTNSDVNSTLDSDIAKLVKHSNIF